MKAITSFLSVVLIFSIAAHGVEPTSKPSAAVWLERTRAEAAAIPDSYDRGYLLGQVVSLYADAGEEASASKGIEALHPTWIENWPVDLALVHWKTDFDGTMKKVALIKNETQRNSGYATLSGRLLSINATVHSIAAADAMTLVESRGMAYMHINQFYEEHGDFKSAAIIADKVEPPPRRRYCMQRIEMRQILATKPKNLREAAESQFGEVMFSVLVYEFADRALKAGNWKDAADLAQYLSGDWKVDLDRRQAAAAWARGDKAAYATSIRSAVAGLPNVLAKELNRSAIYRTRAECGEADRVITEVAGGKPLATFEPGDAVNITDWVAILVVGGRRQEAIEFVTGLKNRKYYYSSCAEHCVEQGDLARVEKWLAETKEPNLRTQICLGVGTALMAQGKEKPGVNRSTQ